MYATIYSSRVEIAHLRGSARIISKYLRQLEAMLLVADGEVTLLLTGTGDVVEPAEGVIAIGSGGPYALAAGLALYEHTDFTPSEIAQKALEAAARICIYTNENVELEQLGA